MIGLLLYLFFVIHPAIAADSDDYVNDIQHGKSVEYYESGKIRSQVSSVDGKEQGKQIGYYESGKVSYQVSYVDGKKQGKEVGYYESGYKFEGIGWNVAAMGRNRLEKLFA